MSLPKEILDRAHAGERRALMLDRDDVIRVISSLRQYREAAQALLEARYGDGECDAVALQAFAEAILEAEESSWGEEEP